MIKKNETFSLLKFLGLGLILDIKNWLSSREGKIPENSTFVPAPKYKFFWGFSPKNPRALNCPPSLPHPRRDFWGFSPKNSWPYGCPCPVPAPSLRGFLGIFLQKIHKHYSSQSLLTSSKALVSESAVQIQVQTISINWTAELDCAHHCTSFYKTEPCRSSQDAEKRTPYFLKWFR